MTENMLGKTNQVLSGLLLSLPGCADRKRMQSKEHYTNEFPRDRMGQL